MIQTLRNIIKRVKLTLVMPDTAQVAQAQVSYLNKTIHTEVVSPYGYSSCPPVNSIGVSFLVQANEENQFAIMYDPSTRFSNLKEWEVQIGNQKKMSSIKFNQDGSINISSAGNTVFNISGQCTINTDSDITLNSGGNVDIVGNNVTIDAAFITLDGDVSISGSLEVDGASTLGIAAVQNVARVGDFVDLITGAILPNASINKSA